MHIQTKREYGTNATTVQPISLPDGADKFQTGVFYDIIVMAETRAFEAVVVCILLL